MCAELDLENINKGSRIHVYATAAGHHMDDKGKTYHEED